MEKLLEYISAYVALEDYEIECLHQVVEKRRYDKNQIIFEEGHVSDEIYFVTQGCIRLFYNVEGNYKTAFFYTEGQFICAGESYTFNIPAKENYQSVEPSEIYIFTKENIEKMLEISSKFEILARIATENELITSQKIIASFVTQTAEQRYLELLETQGELFQRVPQQYIASYLGVSPETMSRIKARIFKKKLS